MMRCLAASVCLVALAVDGSGEDLGSFQTLLGHRSIETRTLAIRLAPVDADIRFSVTLTNKDTGIRRNHEFDAPVPEMPVPFQMEESYYCDTSVVLLTVEYPWRHDWPQVARTMETYAFRDVTARDVHNDVTLDVSYLRAACEVMFWVRLSVGVVGRMPRSLPLFARWGVTALR